jgi:ankyrin repeat protein
MFGYFEQKANEVWNVLAPVPTPEEQFFSNVEIGNLQEVERALQAGLSPNLRNAGGNTLLNVACYNGRDAIVRRLVEAG